MLRIFDISQYLETGVGKLFTRRATLEKYLKARAALFGSAKKKVFTSAYDLFFR